MEATRPTGLLPELFAPYRGLDWRDAKAVRVAVWDLKKATGLKTGQVYELLAAQDGYKTYAALRADKGLKGEAT